tara:strand:- start:73 stop:840 length:768 start_codon:yes stop_codon:yes gene_type:complete
MLINNFLKIMIKYLKKKLRYTFFHYLFLQIYNPKYVKFLHNEKKFHKKFIGKNNLVFDIGANRGDKTHIFKKFTKKVISYEPETRMYKILKERFKNTNVLVSNNLISDKSGMVNFLSIKNHEAHSSIIKKSISTIKRRQKKDIIKLIKKSSTLNQEIKKFGKPGYIKIDCEGAEFLILKKLNKKIKIISIEANLPLFYTETAKIVKNMEKKFGSSFNLRINNEYEYYYKDLVDSSKLLKFLRKKKIICEVFIINK